MTIKLRHAPMAFLSVLGAVRLMAQGSVTARLTETEAVRPAHEPSRAAVFWLEPLTPALVSRLQWTQQTTYRLLQKNRMFSPHLLIVPVGATVSFPNADPLFHNVFSLFDGKRFDLGLYEAGATKDVRFERSGVSYIFCNIHPEMSAVAIALRTPLWSTGSSGSGASNGARGLVGPSGLLAEQFHIADVPAGEYEAHLWVEGEDDRRLAQWTHRLAVRDQGESDAGGFQVEARTHAAHANKFGRPYQRDAATY